MPAIRGSDSKRKTRRKTRDLDQIHCDLQDPKHLSQYKDTKAAEDLPGLGEFYCIECAKWFEAEHNLAAHRKGKPHKRRFVVTLRRSRPTILTEDRLRQLKEGPFSQKESEAAIGLTTDNGKSPSLAVYKDEEMIDATSALVQA